MQSTTTTNYRTKIATVAGDFLKKASAAITGGNFATAEVLCESAGDLLATMRTNTVSPGRGRPRKTVSVAAPGTAKTETGAAIASRAADGAAEKMTDDQFASWLGTQAAPISRNVALATTGWSSQRLNLRGGLLEKAGRIIIQGTTKAKNQTFQSASEKHQVAA
jgi:hypothetical protein